MAPDSICDTAEAVMPAASASRPWVMPSSARRARMRSPICLMARASKACGAGAQAPWHFRSEEHTSELQSQSKLVCPLLLEKKKNKKPELIGVIDLTTL